MMAFMMNKLAMINSFEIILEKKFAKNHCEVQVRTILVCTLYSIKYGI
jgi:TRAP-type mannitol/chloroaromatic compound transport system permease large subunit